MVNSQTAEQSACHDEAHGTLPAHLLESEGGVFLSQESWQREGATDYFQGRARVAGATIRYTYESPVNDHNETPLVLVPGFGGVKKVYGQVRHHVAQAGKPAVTFAPARSQEGLANLDLRHHAHPELLLSMATWAVMKAVTEHHGAEQFDLAGHSMGGPAAASVAERYPDKVNNLILCASAGLEKHNLVRLTCRAPKFLVNELIPGLPQLRKLFPTSVALHELAYFATNPYRSLAEGVAVAHADIVSQVERVREMGVRVVAEQFYSDELFPLNRVQASAEHIVDEFSIFPDRRAGHMAPQIDPVNVARHQLDLLAA